MIGTPFISNNERIQRKVDKINVKPWEQEARDELGRRRFHGAFTGGFSAGYFNTCGSEEGWQPQSFSFSRQERMANKQLKVTDFMDKEDIADQLGEQTTTIKTEHGDYQSKSMSHNILGDLQKEFSVNLNNKIGEQLMLAQGFKVFDDSLSNDYYKGQLKYKTNNNGLGYLSSIAVLERPPIRRLKALNDEDVYDDNDNYDEDYYDELPKEKKDESVNFIYTETLKMTDPIIDNAIVPENWVPKAIFKENANDRDRPSIEKRAKLLGTGGTSLLSKFLGEEEVAKEEKPVEVRKIIEISRSKGLFYPCTLLLKRFRVNDVPSHCVNRQAEEMQAKLSNVKGLSEMQAKMLRDEINNKGPELSLNEKNMEKLSNTKVSNSLFDEIFN